jgi:serine/threonine protein kinase/Tol biopolymer transport system component
MDRLFNNRFRLIRSLGKGSFADVFLAEHVYLKTLVALKILRVHLSPSVEERFLNEARLLVRLKHPHIVVIHDYGMEGGAPFLVIEYALHGSLRQRYPVGTQVPVADILRYTTQIASALQYAHEQRIIHLDIKPANILLGPNDELWLSDFGISLMVPVSRSLILEEVVGTPHYIAPEQVEGHPKVASDQYALAVMVYEWFSGRCPFDGTPYEILKQHLQDVPPPLYPYIPGVTPAIEIVLFRALEKDPQDRYPSIQAFADALRIACVQASQLFLVPIKPLSPPVDAAPVLAPLADQAPVGQEPVVSASRVPAPHPATLAPSQQRPATSGPPERRLSRRAAIFGLLGLAVVVGGGAAALAFQALGSNLSHAGNNKQLSQQPTQQGTTSTPNTIGITIGATVYTYTGHRQAVKSVAWSPLDSKRVASASLDGTVQVWDAMNGSNVVRYTAHNNQVRTVAWSPDGKYLASGDFGGIIRVWTPDGKDIATSPYHKHTAEVRNVAWSPDGKYLASVGNDGMLHVWNPLTGQDIQGSPFVPTVGYQQQVLSVAWSADSTILVTGDSGGELYVWNIAIGQLLFSLTTGQNVQVWNVVWAPKTRTNLFVSVNQGGKVQLWDSTTKQAVATYTYTIANKGATGVAWSPDGTHLVVGGETGWVDMWNVEIGKTTPIATKQIHEATIWSMAWAPNGLHAASGSDDTTVNVWQV